MEKIEKLPSRRGLIKNAAKAAAAITGSAVLASSAKAQTAKPEKKSYPTKTLAPGEAPPLFSSAVSYGNLVFLAGVGYHENGTIEEATKHVLDELEKNLTNAGSSMEKVLKVNVYLNDIKDWARMNTAYAGRWGTIPPVRTTIAPAGGIPGNSLVEIDLIAYI
ncbi:enamine deaminase RidA (YjgF/YER057c/UK114 family) [Silvibacterium bohemicum]|uniref:Enamine deaminase RidA (YjgF/YER057c/UK114 family) n=1 Tax=Silvibacterium bohemicum TaxID=1577686 RepID=A0A841JQA2_9BACT|nr:RidA family protein [Silvibacterium bohemicum]MBB6142605.1 enamine deaminase RidA (YjgF/YER057c/UK114 family) [Silvibacterium bohemicum]